jgi:hypothetical protein
MVHKNKPLTSSSQPNFALNAKNASIFFSEEEHLKNLKTCRGPFLDLDLYNTFMPIYLVT